MDEAKKQEEKSLKDTKCLLTNARLRGKYRAIGILQIIKKNLFTKIPIQYILNS